MQKPFQAKVSYDSLPKYGRRPINPGLYLGLFHGREQPTEPMSDWGFDGPMIGPLNWCHTTYARSVKLEFQRAADALVYFGEADCNCDLEMDGDMLVYGGRYFGDWTLYYVSPEDCERPVDTFRKTKRVNDIVAHQRISDE